MKSLALAAAFAFAFPGLAAAMVSCPPAHLRVVRSVGGTIDDLGAVPGIPDL